MGRLEKMKRLIIEESNKRLLGEEKVVKGSSPIILGFLRIDDLTVDTLSSIVSNSTQPLHDHMVALSFFELLIC